MAGVRAVDSRDSHGNQRFFPQTPEAYFTDFSPNENDSWIWHYTYWPLPPVSRNSFAIASIETFSRI